MVAYRIRHTEEPQPPLEAVHTENRHKKVVPAYWDVLVSADSEQAAVQLVGLAVVAYIGMKHTKTEAASAEAELADQDADNQIV